MIALAAVLGAGTAASSANDPRTVSKSGFGRNPARSSLWSSRDAPNSIAASRVELALEKLGSAQQFYAFHRKVYAQRGITDGLRALAVAHGLGFDESKLTALGDSDEITQTMKNLVALGNSLRLAATPSFIIGGVAILGYPGRETLQAVVDAVGKCGKVLC